MSIGTKMLLVSVSIAAGTLTGFFFSKKLKTRADYYKALCELSERLLSEVKFRKAPIKTVFSEFIKSAETPLNKNVSEYIVSTDPKTLALSRGCLKKEEAAEVEKYFSELGALDSITQIAQLETFLERTRTKVKSTNELREKYGSVYIKLGFLAGLALGVLLL